MRDIPAACDAARRHLSARADHAAGADPAARSHVATCPACQSWQLALASLPTLALPPSPDVTSAAIAAFSRDAAPAAVPPTDRRPAEASRPRGRPGAGAWGPQVAVARGLLVVSGIAGVLVALAALIGTGWAVPLADHLGRDLAGLQGALAAGFLLAAWRPTRYSRGQLPVAAIAALVTVLPGAADASRAATSWVVEAAHLPLLAGAVGLLLLADATGGLLARRA